MHAVRTQKTNTRPRKFLFINAVNEVTRERAQSFPTDERLQRVVRAYEGFKDEPGFTRVMLIEEIWSNRMSVGECYRLTGDF